MSLDSKRRLTDGCDARRASRNKGEEMNYNDSMKRIEEIVAALEAGGIGLDETLKMFEEGAKLLKKCQEDLEQAESKIDGIRLDDPDDAADR